MLLLNDLNYWLESSSRLNASGVLDCDTCIVWTSLIDTALTSNITMNTLHSIANFVCDIVVTNSSVCDYTMKVMAEVVVPILKNSLFSSDYLCA